MSSGIHVIAKAGHCFIGSEWADGDTIQSLAIYGGEPDWGDVVRTGPQYHVHNDNVFPATAEEITQLRQIVERTPRKSGRRWSNAYNCPLGDYRRQVQALVDLSKAGLVRIFGQDYVKRLSHPLIGVERALESTAGSAEYFECLCRSRGFDPDSDSPTPTLGQQKGKL